MMQYRKAIVRHRRVEHSVIPLNYSEKLISHLNDRLEMYSPSFGTVFQNPSEMVYELKINIQNGSFI